SSVPSVYNLSFQEYAKEQFNRLGLTPLSDEILDSAINNSEYQKTLKQYFLAGIIRNTFGRIIEIFLNLDRVLYLHEQKIPAKLTQIFDAKLSPRNIAIIADKNYA